MVVGVSACRIANRLTKRMLATIISCLRSPRTILRASIVIMGAQFLIVANEWLLDEWADSYHTIGQCPVQSIVEPGYHDKKHKVAYEGIFWSFDITTYPSSSNICTFFHHEFHKTFFATIWSDLKSTNLNVQPRLSVWLKAHFWRPFFCLENNRGSVHLLWHWVPNSPDFWFKVICGSLFMYRFHHTMPQLKRDKRGTQRCGSQTRTSQKYNQLYTTASSTAQSIEN